MHHLQSAVQQLKSCKRHSLCPESPFTIVPVLYHLGSSQGAVTLNQVLVFFILYIITTDYSSASYFLFISLVIQNAYHGISHPCLPASFAAKLFQRICQHCHTIGNPMSFYKEHFISTFSFAQITPSSKILSHHNPFYPIAFKSPPPSPCLLKS